ncbi:MAG: hypothetical protein WCC60_00310 [Ilumatobacteraceae bacterium]
MTHTEFLSSILRTVRVSGATSALEQLRAERPAFHVDTTRGAIYHDTRAVFFVWAVERLVAGGLSDFGVLWHPLVEANSPQVWWSTATLASDEAVEHFVPSELARPGEPQPVESMVLAAA